VTHVKRAYDGSRRREQARARRLAVVQAARELFEVGGFRQTTIAAVAKRAGVSSESIYKTFGTKAALAKAVFDLELAGDDEPVPIAERPEYLAIAEAQEPHEKVRRYAALGRLMSERSGPVTARVLESRGAHPEVEEFARTIEGERLHGATAFVGHLAEAGGLRAGLDADRARDHLWVLISPETWAQLVQRRAWTHDQYETWLSDVVADALLERS